MSSAEIDQLAFYWMFALFAGLTSGAYLLGKIGEEKGIPATRTIIAIGTIVPCLLMLFLGSSSNGILTKTYVVLGIRFLNSFLHPAAFFVAAFFSMKLYEYEKNIKMGAYTVFAAISGTQVGYFIAMHLAKNNLLLWCSIFLFFAVLAAAISSINFPNISTLLTTPDAEKKSTKVNPINIVLALLIGCIFNSSLRFHFFFIDAYVSDILIANTPSTGYLYFYLSLGTSLLVFARLFKQRNQLEPALISLIGILGLSSLLVILPIYSLFSYVIFQVAFGIFTAGFLGSAPALIYSLFKDNKLLFHGCMWFSTGYAIANFSSDWLTQEYGFFSHSNFLPMLPLLLSGFCFLTMMTTMNTKIHSRPKIKG